MIMKNNWESRKASIRRHHLPFLKQLADEMELPSISDVVDFVLNQYKLGNSSHTQQQQHSPVEVAVSTPQPQIDLDDAFGSLELE